MKIYSWENFGENFPKEYVWLPEDYPVELYEYEIKWDSEHRANEPRHRKNEERNFQVYDCVVNVGRQDEHTYKRMTFEKRYTLYYCETPSIEDFLREHENEEVLFTRGHFFLKTWMD